jgi:hypothetical protein
MKKINLLKNMLWAVTGAVVLTWSACYPPYFESIEQPEEAELESSFAVDITVACDQDLSEAGRIVSNIGLQLPDSWDEMTTALNTDYRLIFGIKLPLGWTVEDNFPFTGADTGIFSYSESLSMEMNLTYPPGANYYWWMSENPDYLQTSSGDNLFLSGHYHRRSARHLLPGIFTGLLGRICLIPSSVIFNTRSDLCQPGRYRLCNQP